MRTHLVSVLAMLAVLGLAAVDVDGADGAAGVAAPSGFESSYNKALGLAKKDDKPLYMHFTTDWCGWCRRMENDVYAHEKGKQALEAFISVSLDCSNTAKEYKANKALMEKYGGSGYPFLVIVAPDGAVIDAWPGYVKLDDFVQRVGAAQKKFERYAEFVEKARTADPKDLDFQLEALEMYTSTQQWVKMDVAADAVLRLDAGGTYLGKVKLAQLEAARARKNARTIDSLVAEIRKIDPENAGNFLEVALKVHAESLMQKVTPRTLDTQYKKALGLLVERAALKNLHDPVAAKVDIALLQANSEKYKDARVTLEKLLDDEPDTPHRAEIQTLLGRIKQAEAQRKK